MLAGALLSIFVLAVLGWLVWLFVDLPTDSGDDEHADPDNFGV